MKSTVSFNQLKFKIAIIGSGPAGFYAAQRLLSQHQADNIQVHLYESLPIPFGLARYGVAPDHPEVKNCEHKFEETAADLRFKFFGNVQITGNTPAPSPSLSASIPLDNLRPYYDATLLTYGASLDRLLNVPGESTLANVFSARSFVNWYNGHPYTSSILSPLLDLSKIDHVTIIGQGNVALDVARILLKPIDELRGTDLPDYALAELSRSRVKRVEIVGRRGPLQLASTTKELREMMALPGVGFEMDQELLKQAQGELPKSPGMAKSRMRKRALSMLAGGSHTPFKGSNKSWSFEFLKSPTALHASEVEPVNRVGSISYDINELVLPESSTGSLDPSDLSARRTGQTTSNPTDLVMKSVGYRSIGLPGLPFDERRGIVLNEEGRVIDQNGQRLAGLYTSGWLARGPSGVIATTMFDAFATADLLAQDLSLSSPAAIERPDIDIQSLTGSKRVVHWSDWERIDQEERKRGESRGKVREKMTDVGEILDFLC